jgi:hypothetical protein
MAADRLRVVASSSRNGKMKPGIIGYFPLTEPFRAIEAVEREASDHARV